jgi:hypothetical protein
MGCFHLRAADRCRKEIQMNLTLATLTLHGGKTLIKINPLRVNYLVSQDDQYTKIHFGLDQTVDVIGDLEAVEKVLYGSDPDRNPDRGT